MRDAWARGFRELYFSGGEPMLWRDADYTLADAVAEAKRIGFFHVHIYTNGLLGIEPSADLVWVSMDGLPGIFERRRGDHFQQVEEVIRAASHPRVAVIYVIDRNTAEGIEPFLRWVQDTRLPVIGVMVYFHTPYYGRDDLFLTAEERAPIIDQLLGCIRAGLPVINSRAGLLVLKSGNWPRRFPVASVFDVDGESICCRARRRMSRLCWRPALLHGSPAPESECDPRHDEVLVRNPAGWLIRRATRIVRRYLVGADQHWVFEPPPQSWIPPQLARTSLYLHVPFCRHACPYCPYTKVPYRESLVEPYVQAAIAEIDWWANAIGPAEVTSIYIGGGTPTLALGAVARVLLRVRERFRVTGDICIETNPADVSAETAQRLSDMGVALVSLGVESFQAPTSPARARIRTPVAERAGTLQSMASPQ
jgi:MoaA/NifB/PqqE/SkfB family radical SAM enzyme